MKKALFWIVLLIILGFIGYRGYKVYKKSQIKEVIIEEKTKPVEIEVVETTSFTQFLSFTGDIKGIEEIDVFPKVSGKLVQIKVKEGDRVKKDQILALIDRDITGVKFELAEVISPVEGIIGRIFLDKGAGVSPPSPGPQMGTPIFRIVNMDRVKVLINVIEKDLPKIRVGQTAQIKVDAYPEKIFSGEVSLISPLVDPYTRTSQIEITLSNPKHLLKPGMFSEVKIIEKIKKDAILIPSYALLETSSKTKVFLVKGKKAVKRFVEVGAKGTEKIEILTGLSPGESLVVAGHHRIEDGDSVRIVKGVMR